MGQSRYRELEEIVKMVKKEKKIAVKGKKGYLYMV